MQQNLTPSKNPAPTSLAKEYINQEEVLKLVKLLQNKPGGYPVSDVFCVDPADKNKRLHFVDFVQEGGGVLGVALVGYTYALEAAGIRFLSLGGTSAGAINTILMAGIDTPIEAKSLKILEKLCAKDFKSFVDPGKRVLWPLKMLLKSGFAPRLIGALSMLILNFRSIVFKKGLCSGNAFESWVEELLNGQGIDSLEKLQERMDDLPVNLKVKTSSSRSKRAPTGGIKPRLAIIAADITTQTKVEFPRFAGLYSAMGTEAAIKPKDIVRASMAIPFFFQPKSFSPPQGKKCGEQWATLAGYHGPIPDKILMVDGGVMSNFPIDVFHQNDRTPQRPTFGVRLGLTRNKSNNVVDLTSLLGATFNGARNLRDFEFLFQNEDYKHLVKYIDTEEFNWLDFSITEEQKKKLFVLGVQAAYDFLEGNPEIPTATAFNWKQYKALRRRMLFFSSTDRMESLWKKEDAISKLGLDQIGALYSLNKSVQNEPSTTLPNAIQEWLQEHVAGFNENLGRITKFLKTGQQIRILWIDDDPANDCFELSILRALGLDFLTALDNEQALQKLSSHPDICLIVSDSNRDGHYLAGLDFARELYEKDFTQPILMHSVVLASKYKVEHTKQAFMEEIRRDYSPNLVNNFTDTRELIAAIVQEIAKQIQPKK